MDKNTEVWLRMYEEQTRHARHHETLRTHSTNVIVIISAAILVLTSSDNSSAVQHTMLFVFLIAANGIGLFMSLKHWERSCLHHSVSGRYRMAISDHTVLADTTLNNERQIGQTQHLRKFHLLGLLPAHVLWPALHLVIILMAVALLL